MKRDYRKFFTYPEIAERMAKLLNAKKGDYIIEPSAGDGALVKAVYNNNPDTIVHAVELDKQWKKDLKKLCSKVYIGDFLEVSFNEYPLYNGCIANPPFGNGVDLQAHFNKICDIVKPNGRVVMIVPEGFNFTYEKQFIRNVAVHPIENWSKNSDGTTTPIMILEFVVAL